MKCWMSKTFVVLIAILTLGMYVPQPTMDVEAEKNKDTFPAKSNFNEAADAQVQVVHHPEPELERAFEPQWETDPGEADHAAVLAEKAKEQSLVKFGPKIAEQVEEEFTTTILPAMEAVLETVLKETGGDEASYIAITEQPTGGLREKIFHVYDVRTDEDIARFHVRREKRPLEGYWFNFHYHLSKDNFEEHYEIGEIYWDKNVPPKWMA